MDGLLLILSVVCVVAALGSSLIAWRLWRDERVRSDARIAALSAQLDSSSVAEQGRLEAATPLFEPRSPSAFQGRPLVKAAIGFVMAVAVVLVFAMSADRRREPAPSAPAPKHEALELLSMRHERENGALTVTGLVRNPSPETAESVTAVVFVFDQHGNYLTSGRAPIDVVELEAGDESPFQVTIPNLAEVGRYRVSFRDPAGTIRHLDKRTAGARPLPRQEGRVAVK